MPAPTEVQSATLKKFLQGWETITAESWTGLWSDNCTQQFLPFSLGLPPKSREEVLQTLPKLLSVLRDWKLDIHHVVHDPAHSKAAIYATSTANTIFGDFKWNNDYAIFVMLTEDGRQIDRIQEMVDTAFFGEFSSRFQKYMSQQGAPP
ncbi:hypothetical protein ETB97_002367 [Aspergillus alliaceus]|uniref:Uncharacterized protein n=1 Tax=Petromyces alliaceus TaxID=209559 RepID=A0A5N6G1M6_PETAA|nr:uncharacterized protein BDW43DRAFT_309280 [Aspergillus alliaceus]KAB8235415.1 hypothetical protein BDW43DRAFT_309280 [Aspergillus alliaceus]KAF5859876.1 hypothetical protein ETB97_002367 [Aspergillus burnettii]